MLEHIQELWRTLITGGIPTGMGAWSYGLIAFLVAVEGPVTTVIVAMLAGAGVLNPWLAVGAAALGNMTADSLWYGLGRIGHFDTLSRYVPWLRRYQPQIERLDGEVQDHGLKFLFIAKLALWPAIIPTLLAAGMARIPWGKLLVVLAAAEVLWTGSLVLLGDALGANLARFQQWVQWIAVGGVIVIVLALPLLIRRLLDAG